MLRTKRLSLVTLRLQTVALFTGILLVNFWLRVYRLGQPSLWADEILTAYRAQASFQASLESILRTVDQTPFYFWFMRLFPTQTELMLRLPSAVLGMAGTALLMIFIGDWCEETELGLWAGVWLTFNPYHLWLSRTARAYALIFVLSLLLCGLFLMLLRQPQKKSLWGMFLLTSFISYLTHYSLLALPLAQMFYLVQKRAWKLMPRWILVQLVAVIPVLVWLAAMLMNFTYREPQWGASPRLPDLGLTFWNLTVGYDGVLHWYLVPALAVAVIGLLRGIRQVESYWVFLLILPVVLVFVVSIMVMDVYVDRYFMVTLPALVFIIAVGWRDISPDWRRVALLVVVFAGSMTFFSSLKNRSNERESWREVATFIDYQPGDVVVVDRPSTRQAFRYYFPQDVDFIQLTESDVPIDVPAHRYWVIYRNPFEDVHRLGRMADFDPLLPSQSAVSKWLQPRQSEVTEQHHFRGVTVLLVEE